MIISISIVQYALFMFEEYGSENRAKLEGKTGYAGLIVAPTEGIRLQPRLYLPFGQKTQHNYEVF